MNFLRLVIVAAGLLAFARAEELDFNSVVPFTETKASTAGYSLALTFKPQLKIVSGCHPYPAVDSEGNTNAGIDIFSFKSCEGSSLGSQIYGRATTYEDSYAILYSWYFPRDRKGTFGHRHSWEHIIVWIERTSSTKGALSSVSASTSDGKYFTITPPDTDMVWDKTSVKIQYKAKTFSHYVNVSTESGDFQDLVMWEDMSSAARTALNLNDFGSATVPFKEDTFLDNLKNAYPW
uniref:Necrosis inducing-like protein NPP1 type n=1 Tax=Phytophthora ramorum TaxID=164328 RepID=H3GAX4_PHYRM